MKNPLRVDASRAPKTVFPINLIRSRTGISRPIARVSAALAVVVGVGASSAVFVDYLADRAMARAVDAPGIMAQASEAAAPGKAVASQAVAAGADKPTAAAKPLVEPVAQPVKTKIVAALPAPEAVAKVAATVGPEHAVELPTSDPTASPILQLDDADTVDIASLESAEGDAALEDETLPVNAEDDVTAAIPPDASEIPAEPQPSKKQTAKAKPAAENTEIAALPGVDIGGLAGNPAPKEAATGTAKTTVKGRSVRVSEAVNMRSRPKRGSGVILVVPAKAAVNVLSCDQWCEVTYNGKKGWIYKSFVGTSGPAKKKATQAAAKQPAKKKAAAAAAKQPAAPATATKQPAKPKATAAKQPAKPGVAPAAADATPPVPAPTKRVISSRG